MSTDSPRYRPYPAYRDSGVDWLGEIPVHWEARPLRAVARLQRGHDLPVGSRQTGEFPVVSSSGICDYHNTAKARGPGVVTGRYGTIGQVFFVEGEYWPLNTALYVCDFKGNHPRFIYYLVGLLPFDAYSGKSAVPGIDRNDLHPLPVACPPLPEQRAVAAFLDRETAKLDALITQKERLLALLAEKRAALISHAVTKGLDPSVPMCDSGVAWLGEIPAHWMVTPLKYAVAQKVGAVRAGPFGSQLLSSEMMSGDIKVYNQRNVIDRDLVRGDNYISEDKFRELSAFTVHPGDLLITSRGTIGRCAIVPENVELGILHPCLIRVQADQGKLSPEYLSLLVQDSSLVQTQLFLVSNATTIDVIYSNNLRQVIIPLPPLDEQLAIVEHLQRQTGTVDMLATKVSAAIEKLREYRAALISAAVTGKIDVRTNA
jgi:type I restriction enzyme, S subunit